MSETESDSIDIDLSRLNNNILQAIKDNNAAFTGLNKLDKQYILFRLDPIRFIDDCPYRPTMFIVSREINPALINIMNSVDTQSTDVDSEIQPVDLTTLTDHQLIAIANDVDAFEYLNFKEQVWLYNKLGYNIVATDPEPFFPSRWLNTVISDTDVSAGGKRIKSRKPRRKPRRKTRRHN